MKNLLCISAVFLLVIFSLHAQDRKLITKNAPVEQRIALVIGNSTYKDSPLLNPVNDARDMAQTLRGFGFEVIFGENLSQNDMKRNIRAFGQKIRNGGIGLFYYAGHGMQIKGSNYLIPVGATITSEEEVEYESVDVSLVLAQMETARNRLNIVVLDACRNNPFARSFRSTQKGLASIDAPSGTLITYATAPGSVASDGDAKNGIYTQELLKNVQIPGLSIEEVFKRVRASVQERTLGKQTPWESSSLIGDFYFVSTEKAEDSSGRKPTNTAIDIAASELSFWETIKNSNDPEDFKAYLKQYPNGHFSELAKIRAMPKKKSERLNGDAITGEWSFTISAIRNVTAQHGLLRRYMEPSVVTLKLDRGKVSGNFGEDQNDSISGTWDGQSLQITWYSHFHVNHPVILTAEIVDGIITGSTMETRKDGDYQVTWKGTKVK